MAMNQRLLETIYLVISIVDSLYSLLTNIFLGAIVCYRAGPAALPDAKRCREFLQKFSGTLEVSRGVMAFHCFVG